MSPNIIHINMNFILINFNIDINLLRALRSDAVMTSINLVNLAFLNLLGIECL